MKVQTALVTVLLVVIGLAVSAPAAAHVPYLERFRDFSADRPFVVEDSVEKSIAVYAWFKTGFDVDVYQFTINEGEPAEVFAEALVPACAGYEEFRPWFAVVGPGLEEPEEYIPFALPDGYGAIVVPNEGERDIFYEPFGGKSYYDGPDFRQVFSTPGDYYIVYWDPCHLGGDYVAVIGDQEIWLLPDIIRALIVTPLIRQDRELHYECIPLE